MPEQTCPYRVAQTRAPHFLTRSALEQDVRRWTMVEDWVDMIYPWLNGFGGAAGWS